MDARNAQYDEFQRSLKAGGERAALKFLSSLTGFRYVAVIFYQEGRGHFVHFFDNSNPEITGGEEIDQRASYCSKVIADEAVFQTSDSSTDARLQDHPARDFVKAYFGVPIFSPDGSVHAVLCHFDVQPRDTGKVDGHLLSQAAAAFQSRLAGYKLDRPVTTVSSEYSEKCGASTLHVIERRKADWNAPRYSVERTRIGMDGGASPRQVYGRDGFLSFSDALEFGRQWCNPDQ